MNKEFSFGDFTIDAVRRLLLNNGKPVNLNPKAFDLLLVLVENYGKTLSKDELLGTVWEGQFVEENNLTVHISTLRKIFGERRGEHRYIVTIPGRGYTFVAKVHESRSENSAPNFSAAGGETPPPDASSAISRESRRRSIFWETWRAPKTTTRRRVSILKRD